LFVVLMHSNGLALCAQAPYVINVLNFIKRQDNNFRITINHNNSKTTTLPCPLKVQTFENLRQAPPVAYERMLQICWRPSCVRKNLPI